MSLILQNFDKYVYRGERSDFDWQMSDFEIDGDYHPLDLSGIIPIGTKVVHFRGIFKGTEANMQIVFKTAGNTGNFDGVDVYTPAVQIYTAFGFFIVPSADRKIEYWCQSFSGTWYAITLTIAGWII